MVGLRTRLTITYTGFFGLALLLLAVGLYFGVRQALLNSVQNELNVATRRILEEYNNTLRITGPFPREGQLPAFFVSGLEVNRFDAPSLFVQVWTNDRRVLDRSQSLTMIDYTLPLDDALLTRALDGEPLLVTQQLGSGKLMSMITPLTIGSIPIGALQVSTSLHEMQTTLSLLLFMLLVGGMIMLLIGALGGAWMSSLALRPIDAITTAAQGIVRAEDLARRVPVPAAQDELYRLSLTINDLFERLDALFSMQRRFLADISHELRTPLAAMQGNLEVLQRGAARDPELLAESLTDMRQETGRLIRMVNDLLLLARTESGIELRHDPVELDTLLLEVHRELRSLIQGVALRIGNIDQVTVHGDRDRLKQALLNLTVNALQHTPSDGRVTLALYQVGDDTGLAESGAERPELIPPAPGRWAALEVSDTGSGIPAEALPQLFDRFYRADPARGRSGTGPIGRSAGAGLGLAIVRWVAEAHGGCVVVRSAVGVGSMFIVWVPRSASQPLAQSINEPE